jgi:protein tyrosine/serine phosphatase
MANPVKFPAFDLSTPEGRRAAERDLVWTDHGFLRNIYQNFHWIEQGVMARSNQPSPAQIALYAEKFGVKTILNARGKSDTGYYLLEKEACERHGIALIDLRLRSREPPSVEAIHRCKQIFETIQYPALMHCKSGADRAGVAAVLYKHFKMGMPISAAIEQLSFKYLHVKQGKTGMIDYFFATYLDETKESGKPFLQWVDEDYDQQRVKGAFTSQWWANILTDKILRRE